MFSRLLPFLFYVAEYENFLLGLLVFILHGTQA